MDGLPSLISAQGSEMTTTYVFPDTQELTLIEQEKLPRLTAMRPIFDIFPLDEVDDSIIAWEQMDSYHGLQQVRGLNGAPAKIAKQGAKRFIMEPGSYGEFEEIDERELTRRRQYGTIDQAIVIDDLVAQAQDRLLERRLDRIEWIGWTLLATGTFSVAGPAGSILHTDAYTTQSFAAPTTWATFASATPLMDFRNAKLLGRGKSVRFDASAKAYMNSTTANNMYSNTNSADLYGRRTQGLGTFNSPEQINQLLLGDNLPQIVEYDETYLDETGTYQLFIPNNKVIVVGTRPSNVPVGRYMMTRNANNPDLAPGAYMKVIDRGVDSVPRSIEVHDGHNGGPALEYPSAVIVMSV